ncbi:SusC/RagA family TonB-linked outer membrane protein [Flavobacterium algicola]|uniref:SusC/RagA family TonB-linked outer membrane protein n=1 Tax=Flavobacterium algicola TaxID=556529 RepID=UPI001EFCBADA|nr:TonB-dependent receptor [Flavobacterium algicola]MCG9790898.1 TonB-dependent receptor [Flavobacterium algicola]
MKKTILMFLLVFSSIMNAQTDKIKISGKVLDNTGLSIPNATVTVDGKSTITDFDGKFVIMADGAKSVLKFSYLGFETKSVTVGKNTTVTVSLAEANNQLNEIVVVGYGSLKKSNVTSSVSSYKNEKMDQLPVSRVDQALQGKIAGVQIQNTSSAAGEAPVIRIRGQASVNASPNPLVVVDGQPIDDGLASINMADVQEVSVLKDASSAAIYGSRGANGVILVTTKSGSSKKTTYSFTNAIGFKSAYKTYDIQSTSDYVRQLYTEKALREADPLWTGGSTAVATGFQKQYIFEQLYLGGEGVDYQDEFLRTGTFRNIGLSAAGGGKGFTYRISGGYNGDESMVEKSNYKKYQFRVKMNVDLNSKLSLGVNIAPTYSKTQRPANDYRDYYRFPSFMPITYTAETLAFVQKAGAYSSLKVGDYVNPQHFYGLVFPNYELPDGTMYTSTSTTNPWTTSSINPLKVLNLQDDDQDDFRIQSSFDLNYKVTKALTFKTTASAYFKYTDRMQWVGTNANAETNTNFAIYTRDNTRDLLSENTLNYVKDFKKHSFNVLAGFSAQRTDYYYSSFQGNGYANDNIRTFNNATTITLANSLSTSAVVGEVENATALLSYYGRLVYSYDDFLNLTATVRRDGASQFGPGNKWGTFSSISAGANLAKLDFIKSSDVISKLNLRAAYGQTGNNRTDKLPNTTNAFNPYLNTLETSNYVTGTGTGTSASGQVTINTVGANPDITWETTVSANLGLDISLFRNRINVSADFYESNTDKLLLQTNNQLFTGTALQWSNVGSLQNRGHEIELSTTNIKTKDFRWTTSANYASNRLKLKDFGGLAETPQTGERGEQYITQVGKPLVQFYGYKTDGVWLSQDQINESGFTAANVSVGTLTPGGLKLVDVNGDGKITTDDRTVIGDPYADFTWGITNSFEYKGIDLSFGFQGVQGIQMYQGDTGYTEVKRQVLSYTANHWISPSNPGDGKTPYETNGGLQWVQTDYGIDDASYIALREVTLGYTLRDEWVKRIGLNQFRMYFTGQNLLYYTAKSFRGINPESRKSSGTYANSLITGYDRGGYPVPKTLVFGFDVKF